ncbi:MAG: FAD-dependent oxidoreductase [Oscillospiraceae bacterium]|nr:FAD-dependent oxidoreductase [Oscillospiraceae bacterium]
MDCKKAEALEIPVSAQTDVLVVGGGIAGVSAAMAAARAGAKVTLIEREYGLGGMATLGLIAIYLALDDGLGNQVIRGISEELLLMSIKYGCEGISPEAWLRETTQEERAKNRYVAQFNPNLFALEMEKTLVAMGVKILYGTLACETVMEGNRIQAVVVENKSGRSRITCKNVVDCSGDADVAYLAGAETALHEGGNGLASWYYYQQDGAVKLKMFGLADVPVSATPPEEKKGDNPYGNATVTSLTNMRFSGVDAEELSEAVIQAHTKMYEDILARKAEDPNYAPVSTSSIPLVRMSRRICGEYTLDEAENRVAFDDSIGCTGDWRKRGPAFEIPYRTLYSAKVPNLICAGRIISVTDRMWDVTRVIPPCAVTGEAAGLAAAMTDDFSKLDVKELQKRLVENNVQIHI